MINGFLCVFQIARPFAKKKKRKKEIEITDSAQILTCFQTCKSKCGNYRLIFIVFIHNVEGRQVSVV